MTPQTKLLSTLACIISLLAGAEMQMDYSSPYRNPCSGSATMGHNGDITYVAIPDNNREKRGATANPDRLWPGARIPYLLDSRYTGEERRFILEAMRRWEEDSCVRFIERPADHESSYVYIFRGAGCCSFVGRQSENFQQGLSLGRSCMKHSTILHELGHVIGFWHEQSRPDRDEYINILTQNIGRGQQSNFDQFSEDVINSLGVPYDYNSIMHYNNDTFGGGRATILAHDPIIPVGRAVDLSKLDILQANLLYNCSTTNFPPIETQVPPEPIVTLPPLPECGKEIVKNYSGSFHSPGYPTYTDNQDCVWRITVPEGMLVTVTVTVLHLDWSELCVNDRLVIYNTPDASAEPVLHPRCGVGSNMVVPTKTNVAYVSYHTDEDNIYAGNEGFSATFSAEDVDECQEYNGGCSQHCRNLVPGYECHCDSGWFLSADLKICFDDNECAVKNGGCQDKCVNNGGSYTCECSDGSELNADGRSCTNADATCDVDNGGCEHICSESHAGVSCRCREGYRLHPNGASCLDIDECFEGTDTCSYGGCRNTPGAYNCTCHSGYEKDTDTDSCINVNECRRGLHGCDGFCSDTDGSYVCSCPQGLKLDANQHSCIDINECQDQTICSHFCVNDYGSYQCTCPEGYLLDTDGSSCVDINECLEGACAGVGATCQNTAGSYECQCVSGYGLSSNGQTCEDINECVDGQNNCEHGCSNTEGSFVCTCPAGFMLTSDGHSCKCGGRLNEASGSFSSPGWPINYPQENFECEWFIDIPNTEATIEFTIDGSAYGINGRAPCPTDYIQFFDGMNTNANSLHKVCKFDNPGPFTTTSSQARVVFASSLNIRRPASRVGVHVMYNTVEPTAAITNPTTSESITTNPTTSEPHVVLLVDECAINNGGCEHTCVDTTESYYCKCLPDYILNDDERSCRCGGVFTAGTEGSFQTPGWPNEYPQKKFNCTWTVITSSEASRIEFNVDPSHYGINGRPPCTNDFLQFYNGLDQSSPIGEKYCFLHAPPNQIYAPSNKATIVFKGTVNRNRPPSRVGVKVNYRII